MHRANVRVLAEIGHMLKAIADVLEEKLSK
jgi:hypothetical protein